MGASSRDQTGRIILCNSKEKLERILGVSKRRTRLLVLDSTGESQEIRDYMSTLEWCEEIDRADAVRLFRPGFKARYVEWASELNRANHSFFWLASHLTWKESLYTKLAKNVFYCGLIGHLMEQSPSHDLVVVTNDPGLAGQVAISATAQGFEGIKVLKTKRNLSERAKSFLPLRVAYTLSKALLSQVLIKMFCHVPIDSKSRYIVVATLMDEGCFRGDGEYKDIYFGELPDYMSKNGVPVLVYGGVRNNLWKLLNVLRRQKTPFPVIPWQYYGSMPGLLKASWHYCLRCLRPVKLKGNTVFDGIEVRYLVKEALRWDLLVGYFFNSVWMYYSAKALAKQVNVAACVYPYENRPWEKMLMAGLSSNERAIRVAGYNHTSIAPVHTQYFLGSREAEFTLLPGTIIVMGETNKQTLECSGNYPEGIFRVGCALRQGRSGKSPRVSHRRRKIANVLVVLASNIGEYVATLFFLEKAFEGVETYQVGVRPHVAIPWSRAVPRLRALKLKFELTSGSLEDDLDWADVVVYVSTTVGLTAISRGIPTINIDLEDFMEYDPAPENCPLKWSVSDPRELVPTLQMIEAIGDDDFEAIRQQAREFENQYFGPVTDESLEAFTKLLMDVRDDEA